MDGWLEVISPMPGWVQISEGNIELVKQFTTTEPVQDEKRVLGIGLSSHQTYSNLLMQAEQEDLDLDIDVEFGWFEAVPAGLVIYDSPSEAGAVCCMLVAGEEIHVIARQHAWVQVDS